MNTLQQAGRGIGLAPRPGLRFGPVIKGIVGGSVALLAIFGTAAPLFGLAPDLTQQGVVAGLGGLIGAGLALRG